VSGPSVPLVGVPVHPVALELPPELPRRAAASTRRSAATSARPLALLASPSCARRVEAFSVSIRGPEPWIRVPPVSFAALRRRSRSP
jgi:hypothetical protein